MSGLGEDGRILAAQQRSALPCDTVQRAAFSRRQQVP